MACKKPYSFRCPANEVQRSQVEPIWVFPKIGGTPISSILIGFSIINHPFWGTPIFGNPHILGRILEGLPVGSLSFAAGFVGR